MIIGYSDGERKTAYPLQGVGVRQGRQVTLDRLDDVWQRSFLFRCGLIGSSGRVAADL